MFSKRKQDLFKTGFKTPAKKVFAPQQQTLTLTGNEDSTSTFYTKIILMTWMKQWTIMV